MNIRLRDRNGSAKKWPPNVPTSNNRQLGQMGELQISPRKRSCISAPEGVFKMLRHSAPRYNKHGSANRLPYASAIIPHAASISGLNLMYPEICIRLPSRWHFQIPSTQTSPFLLVSGCRRRCRGGRDCWSATERQGGRGRKVPMLARQYQLIVLVHGPLIPVMNLRAGA